VHGRSCGLQVPLRTKVACGCHCAPKAKACRFGPCLISAVTECVVAGYSSASSRSTGKGALSDVTSCVGTVVSLPAALASAAALTAIGTSKDLRLFALGSKADGEAECIPGVKIVPLDPAAVAKLQAAQAKVPARDPSLNVQSPPNALCRNPMSEAMWGIVSLLFCASAA
jgi:hypothetical protein